MRRVYRIFASCFTFFCAVCCAATAALWIRSHYTFDHLERGSDVTGATFVLSEYGHVDYATIRTDLWTGVPPPGPNFPDKNAPPSGYTWTALPADRVNASGLFQPDAPGWRIAGVGFGRWTGDGHGVPLYVRVLRVPLWLPCALWAVPPLLWIRRRYRTRDRRLRGHCPTCGYDLRATPARCPECGREAGAS